MSQRAWNRVMHGLILKVTACLAPCDVAPCDVKKTRHSVPGTV